MWFSEEALYPDSGFGLAMTVHASDPSPSRPSGYQQTLDERSPLLPVQDDPSSERNGTNEQKRKLSPTIIRLILILTVVFVSAGDQLFEYPQIRIFESVICYRYFERADPSRIKFGRDSVGPGAIGGVDEMWCKADPVQADLATLIGYQQLFDGIPSLLLALPFGWAADTFGRWPVLFVSMLGLGLRAGWMQFVTWNWQAFNVHWVWLSSAFGLLGGGNPVAVSMIFVALSDVTSQTKRATAFLRLSAASILPNLLMPPLAAWLMEINPWIPSLGGTCLMICSTLLLLALPETLGHQNSTNAHSPDDASTSRETQLDDESQSESDAANFSSRLIAKIKSACSFLTQDWRIIALLVPFFVYVIAGSATQLLLQYMSKRYELTFSKGTLLIAVRNCAQVLLLAVILPLVSSSLIGYWGFSSQAKDLYLARISELVSCAGWILVGLSPIVPVVSIGLIMEALGQGSAVLLRSFLTSLVPSQHVARIFTMISLIETLGVMLGMPMLAELFKRGLTLGNGWIGLPFCFIGLLSAMMAVLLCFIRQRKGDIDNADENED